MSREVTLLMLKDENIFNVIIHISLMVLLAIGLTSCNSTLTSGDQNLDQQIDSLIQTERLTNQTIILRFGGEAVTAIETQKGIVVVDAGIATGLTSYYRRLIEKEFHRSNFALLILTHGHHDHFGGSSVFADAKIVAHDNCLNAMDDRWKYPDKVKSNLLKIINEYDQALDTLENRSEEWIDNYELKVRFQSAYDDIMNNRTAKIPDLTFSDTMSINMGDIAFHMIWFGKAHSESDILIHVPELNILFTGDLFSKYGRPSVDDLKGIDSIRFDRVNSWTEQHIDQIQIIVGGYGQILSKEDLSSFYRKIQQASAAQ